ncbi:hypothetical protein [Roseospira goensis]|uniref:NIPSNAP family protein n=1 Tax=Roseospira goensis TaxID=391922 RepID=A0A7W6RZV6_9PROT|nr:hypothetical protein [Roseospira goensis]MBB4286281.1 hypothetical protein [Roseospira goensis]
MTQAPVRYLQVTLDLPSGAQLNQMFAQYMRELLPTFQETPWPGWRLVLSATRKPGEEPSSAGTTPDVQQYLHVWRVRDYNSLPYIMEYFDDDEVYRQLDGMVLREVQDFFGALQYNPLSTDPGFQFPSNTRYYLHITFDVVADPEPLSQFETFMIDTIADPQSPMVRDYGFTFVLGSYAQTGRLRRYVHVWATPAGLPPAEEAVAWLAGQPAVKKAMTAAPAGDNPQWALWQPIDYEAGADTP